jgi:hypothetical protein
MIGIELGSVLFKELLKLFCYFGLLKKTFHLNKTGFNYINKNKFLVNLQFFILPVKQCYYIIPVRPTISVNCILFLRDGRK